MATTTMPVQSGDESKEVPVHATEEDDHLQETINPEDLYQRPKPAPPEWIELVLEAVNNKRAMHWTPPLIWSELCYEYAKRQADTCSAKGKLLHGLSDTIQGRLGQLYLGPRDGGGPFRMNRPGVAEKMVELWYKEMNFYNFNHPGHHEKSANFEQLVWFGSTSLGVAVSKDGKYCVANFYPAGPDPHGQPPGEKGRKNYFPAGMDTTGRVLDVNNQEKYRTWFKTNVRPLKDGPPPWLGPPVRPESPDLSGAFDPIRVPSPKLSKLSKSDKLAGSASPGKRAGSPGSPKSDSRSQSPKSKARIEKQKSLKKGKSSKSLGRSLSRGSDRSLSRGSSRRSKSPSDIRKKDGMKLMKPNSRGKSPPSRGKSPKSQPNSRGKSPKADKR